MRGGKWAIALASLTWGVVNRTSAQQIRPVQIQSPPVETTLAGALGRLAARAGVVFVGTVEAIDRGPGAVEVSLRVEQVIQGQPGARYVLREWAGRWPLGLNRYTVGQHALFFLNAPGPSGLSSPVDGAEGVVPVFGDPATGAVLGVARLNASLLRQVGDKLGDTQTMSLQQATQIIVNSAQSGQRRPANPSGEQPLPIMVPGDVALRPAEGPHAAR